MKENPARCRATKCNAHFIYIVNILRENVGVLQLSSNNCKPVCHLFIDIVSLPLQWLKRPRFETLAFAEAGGPILVRRLNPVIACRDLEGGGPLADDPLCEISQIFRRNEVTLCYNTQDLISEGFFFGRGQILATDCGVTFRLPSMNTVPERGRWDIIRLSPCSVRFLF